MTQKIPPPPQIASQFPELNRWFVEIQSILSNNGGIDPDQLNGLEQGFAEIENQIVDLQRSISILQLGLQTTNQRLRNSPTLLADSIGVDGDWLAVTATGARGVYVKVASVWVKVAP